MASPRLAVPVVALSVVTDLAKGFDDGQAMRTAVLAVRIADRLKLDADLTRAAYWIALLRFSGCTATASEMAAELYDELAISAAFAAVDPTDLRAVVSRALSLHPGRPDRVVKLLLAAPRVIARHEVASCEVAGMFARGVGLPEPVAIGLTAAFERYDGRGHPGKLSGDGIPVATRVAQAAQLAELSRGAGLDPVRRGSGRALDPVIAAAVIDAGPGLFEGLDHTSPEEVLACEPQPWVRIDDSRLDSAARAIGAVVDLKSPFLVGHSHRVAACAASAGIRAGLERGEVDLLRRAGWLHDVGRAAVTSRIWDKPGPLTAAEWEQVRTHPYYSRRVLSQVPEWADIAEVAGGHHERLDGSGYPDGLRGPRPLPTAILAAADTYCTLGEPRPHRPAFAEAEIHQRLRSAVAQGRLQAAAVDAVLGIRPGPPGDDSHLPAADHAAAADAGPPTAQRSPAPGSGATLTAREREVLALIARGLTNRGVASRLGISAKTVNAHLEHIYVKLGVSCRAAAVFHAAREGL